MAKDIAQLVPGPGERHILAGGSRSGKSSFQDWTIRCVQHDRPTAMQILVDTKPRYRAETERGRFKSSRKDAAHRYQSWTKGPTVPNSVVVDIWDEKPFHGLFDRPGEIAIMQSGEQEDWTRMLALLKAFTNAHIQGRERRIIVDEALDFYGRNTLGIAGHKNDVFYRAARAGGERAIGIDLGVHRLHGVPPLIIQQLSRVTLFHLRSDSDMKYLQEMGVKDATSPEGNYIFRQYTVEPGGTVSHPFTGTLSLPDSYLKQLSAT